jgi:hypothetical protein
MNYYNKIWMLKSKCLYGLFMFGVFIISFESCNKNKPKGLVNDLAEILPNAQFEITSVTLNGTERLEEFYRDSCFCKKLYFNWATYSVAPYTQPFTVFFSDCNKTNDWGLFPSYGGYNWLESDIKPNKFAFLNFNSFTQSLSNCKCGRFGYSKYNTVTKVDGNEVVYETDLPDGLWVVTMKKIN